MKPTPRPVEIFVSYSHQNKEWFGKLRPLLNFKTSTNLAHIWHDHELKAGDLWDQEIRKALEQMDIFLCLLSYEYLASDYIRTVEKVAAFNRHEQGKTIIVPLLLCDMDHRDVPEYKPFNPLPAWGRSWRSYEVNGGHSMDAHKPIRTGLNDVIENIQTKLKAVKNPPPAKKPKR